MKATLALALLATGCFGYNSSAKHWAYAGDVVLVAGGGAAIAGGLVAKPDPCNGPGCATYKEPVNGGTVAGVVLVTAGIVGIILNATRATVKTSR